MFYVYIEVLIVFSWRNLVYSRIASLSNIQAKKDDRMRENKSKTWNKIFLRDASFSGQMILSIVRLCVHSTGLYVLR